jgi:hypothetical protein
MGMAALAACNSQTSNDAPEKGQLSADLVKNPHSANGVDKDMLSKMATIDFTDTMHDFGTVHEGEILEYDFHFKNGGQSPLIIGSAAGSCGCTVADYPHEPVQPGQEGIMKVKFNTTGKSGYQEKSVTISSNANRGLRLLLIKAQVEEKKD